MVRWISAKTCLAGYWCGCLWLASLVAIMCHVTLGALRSHDPQAQISVLSLYKIQTKVHFSPFTYIVCCVYGYFSYVFKQAFVVFRQCMFSCLYAVEILQYVEMTDTVYVQKYFLNTFILHEKNFFCLDISVDVKWMHVNFVKKGA